MSKRQNGFTLIEIIIIMAITLIILGIGALSGRNALQNSQERNSLEAIKQSIWQGASSASARGAIVLLKRSGTKLSLVNEATNKVIRTYDLSSHVSTNLPSGTVLKFLPPGEIEQASYNALTKPIVVTTSKGSYNLSVSMIGEVLTEVKND